MRLSHLAALLTLPQDLTHLILLAATSSHLITPVAADQTPYVSSVEYDAGFYGSYPIHQFATAWGIEAPRVNILQQSDACWKHTDQRSQYTFISPRGKIARPTPVILDENGAVVWATGPDQVVAYNFRVQKFKGEDVLTYWEGDDQVVGHGAGEYHVLNSAYEEIKRFNAGNGLAGDLHEFIILENNTALITIYDVVPADLSSVGGPQDGEIWESIFQEIDLDTNEVLFEWRATDHYEFKDTVRQLGEQGVIGDPWDWFHTNSIDKDNLGNYLISARYTHSLTYLDGRTGEILWILGGGRNGFEDLSDGRATNFAGQHDARWHDNYTIITLFDNGADYETHDAEWSRGMRLAVNTTSKTVELLVEYIDPGHTLSESQGSLQVLPNDNVLVGWGFNGAFTEFDKAGKVLCDVHFESQSAFGSGDVQSYRAFKQSWKGYPKTEPSVAVVGSTMFISWNGATEVKTWSLKFGDDINEWEHYEEGMRVPKAGFETTVNRNRIELRFLRVEGLDANGTLLGTTGTIDLGDYEVPWLEHVWNKVALRGWRFFVPTMCVVAFMVVFGVRKVGARKGREKNGGYVPVPLV